MSTTLNTAAIPADDPRRNLADREIVTTDSPLNTSSRVQFHSLGVGMFEAIKWPEEMAPSRSPIHFTNELEVAASPETIWSLLVDPKAWPSFYPGVEHVHLLDEGESLGLGRRFETNLAGQDVFASVQEFEPITRIAWGDFPKVAGFQSLSRLDHHPHAERLPSSDRGDDAGSALDRVGEESSRRILAHRREAA